MRRGLWFALMVASCAGTPAFASGYAHWGYTGHEGPDHVVGFAEGEAPSDEHLCQVECRRP